MTILAERPRTTKAAHRGPKSSSEQLPDVALERAVGEHAGIQPAFRAYVQSRKGLASAFRKRARHDREAFVDAEKKLHAYEEAMQRAITEREEAEQQALKCYAEALCRSEAKASEEYRQRMRQALTQCRVAIEQAWNASVATSEDVTAVFASDSTVPLPLSRPVRTSPVRTVVATTRSNAVRLWSNVSLPFRKAGKTP